VFLLSKPYRKDELARKVRGILDTRGMPAPQTTPAAAPAEQQKPLNILVVEDEMLVRMSTVDMLEQLGHKVTETEDGQSALAALEADGKIDLLITDLGLVGMSGEDLVMQVKQLRPDIRIVVASGYELPEGMANHGTVHLGKPFQLGDLRAAVANAVAKGDD
jgi:CheY-like chemotaxis protein